MKRSSVALGIVLAGSGIFSASCGGVGQNNGNHGAGGIGGFGSGGNAVGGASLGGLDPLPPPATVDTDIFSTADRCAMCHAAEAGSSALRDAAGRDVSPFQLWRVSMMSFSGRDPYWLAALSHELDENPGAKETIEATCTRCHAPAAAVTHAQKGEHVTFDEIVSGTSDIAVLAREGVGCAVCHQIKPDNLGQPSSFTGNYQIGTERLMFGPHKDPFPMPMQHNVNFTPTYATHVTDSALCATCHTVITRSLDEAGKPNGPEVPEQVPYLEWQNSTFAAGPSARSCASCHMPTTDEDGNLITTRISNRPPWLDARSPFGRHTLAGGNAYMLGLLAENAAWTGTNVPQSAILEGETRAKQMLETAATIQIAEAKRANGELMLDIAVENHTGHKLPTAYPSRRIWVHLTLKDQAGAVLFESGRVDDNGALVDAAGQRLDKLGTLLPHHDEITSASEVQVYESVMSDASGAPTHVLLAATGYAKDNRILPAGWSAGHANAAMTKPVGVGNDPTFAPGADHIHYRIAAPQGPLQVSAELLYQSVPPTTADVLAEVKTKAAVTFGAMMKARPPLPQTIATTKTSVP